LTCIIFTDGATDCVKALCDTYSDDI
jgi:hypothetical protein